MANYQRRLPPRLSSNPPIRSRRSHEGPSLFSSGESIYSSSSAGSNSSQFQMMNIAVSVVAVEGLVMDSKDQTKDSLKRYMHEAMDTIQPTVETGNMPVTAVISCFKNVSGNKTIATHIPSLPLGSSPSFSQGKGCHNFIVRWPSDYNSIDNGALSTFRCSRLMKKDAPPSNQMNRHGLHDNGYSAEEIEMNIGLLRGSEMIILGATQLVITGEGGEDMTLDLPINNSKSAVKKKKNLRSPSPLRRTGSKIFGSPNSTKAIKAKSFQGDPKRKYRLDESATVRVRVRVTPATSDTNSTSSSYESEHENNVQMGLHFLPQQYQHQQHHPQQQQQQQHQQQQLYKRPPIDKSPGPPPLVDRGQIRKTRSTSRSKPHPVPMREQQQREVSREPLRDHGETMPGIPMAISVDSLTPQRTKHYYEDEEVRGRRKAPVQQQQRRRASLSIQRQRQADSSSKAPSQRHMSLDRATGRASSRTRSPSIQKKNSTEQAPSAPSLFETILSRGASFMTPTGTPEEEKKVKKQEKKSGKGLRMSFSSSQSYEDESGSESGSDESDDSSSSSESFYDRGRSPPRRRSSRTRSGY